MNSHNNSDRLEIRMLVSRVVLVSVASLDMKQVSELFCIRFSCEALRCHNRRLVLDYWYQSEQQITRRKVNHFCDIYVNINIIICCDHSLESSLRDDSNELSQHMKSVEKMKVSI